VALVDIIDSLAPGWAKDRPHWWGAFRLAAVLIDGIVEVGFQGMRASMPNAIDLPGVPGYGGFEDVKSLDMIGRDLGIIRGLTESPPDYAYRLRHAHDPAAGGWEAPPILGMFEQLAGALGPNPPLMRIISLGGSVWWTREQDGTIRYQVPSGVGFNYNTDGTKTANTTLAQIVDWDSASNPAPPDQGFVGRWVLVLYIPVDSPYGTVYPYFTYNAGAVYGCRWDAIQTPALAGDSDPDACTYGTNSPAKLVAVVQGVIAQRRAVGFECIYTIIASDPASFNPDGSSPTPPEGSTYPDGTWGWSSRPDPGTGTRIPSRNSTAEYWKTP
jgi:hypothetical protein